MITKLNVESNLDDILELGELVCEECGTPYTVKDGRAIPVCNHSERGIFNDKCDTESKEAS